MRPKSESARGGLEAARFAHKHMSLDGRPSRHGSPLRTTQHAFCVQAFDQGFLPGKHDWPDKRRIFQESARAVPHPQVWNETQAVCLCAVASPFPSPKPPFQAPSPSRGAGGQRWLYISIALGDNKGCTMKTFPFPDNRHLEAAEGWLGLGNWKEATEELESIRTELRDHPFVLEVRYKIYEAAGRWKMALAAAERLRELLPDNPLSHVHLAFALHELKRTQEAYNALRPVLDQFPDAWLMRYNLACYACQLCEWQEAMQWLKKAIKLAGNKEICALALEDTDLKPLWVKIEALCFAKNRCAGKPLT